MIETTAPNDIVRRGNETILVVDDEDMIRDAMRLLLECHGYTVLDANGGNEALRLFRHHQDQIALTIIDRRMQPMSGKETLSRLRTIAPELKVILSSGDDQMVQLLDGESEGVAAVLPKPFLLDEFWHVMRHTLENSAFAAADQSI
jgi:CheY-like chemotaxis protein